MLYNMKMFRVLIVFVIGIILCILLWLDREKNDNN